MSTAAAAGDRRATLAAYDIVDAAGDDRSVVDLVSLCELAATLAGASGAVVTLVDERAHQVAAYGRTPAPCPLDESMCGATLAGGRDLCLSDAGTDPGLASLPWVDGRLASIRLYCSTILRSPEGDRLGTLCVFDEQVRGLREDQVRALRLLGRRAVDVLELRRRARQLARSNAEVARAQDRLAAFAGQVSHDLKAPISAIVGFCELLGDLDTIVEDRSAAAYVERCTSAARRMLAMIDDLLAYARVGGTLTAVPNPIEPVVAAVVAELGAVAADAEITAAGTDVVADRAQLQALLQNLIGNAVRYGGADPLRVQVISEVVGDATVLRVIDNGGGIPPASREEVLRPLVRLRKDVPGAGLGLAVCVRVAVAHGGTLRLDGTPGGGTTAVVTLPHHPAPERSSVPAQMATARSSESWSDEQAVT
ncbi:MAG: ATP-binding protein [Jatrophihabitantaceae bacterium]